MARLSHISDDECTAILLYTNKCLEMLELSHYQVILQEEPCEEDGVHGTMDSCAGRYVGSLAVARNWNTYSQHIKMTTILHEMLHLIHHQVNEGITSQLDNHPGLSQAVYDMFWHNYQNNIEFMVDKLTTIFTKQDLLPTWPSNAEIKRAVTESTSLLVDDV